MKPYKSSYPFNDARRSPYADPMLGNPYPEEVEVLEWAKQTPYEFAEFSEEAGGDWRVWRHWAVPVAAIYADYRKWKAGHLYDPYDPFVPQILDKRQFGVAVRWCITRGVSQTQPQERFTVIMRNRKNIRVMRGVKHPDAFYIHHWPGRRPGGFEAPLRNE